MGPMSQHCGTIDTASCTLYILIHTYVRFPSELYSRQLRVSCFLMFRGAVAHRACKMLYMFLTEPNTSEGSLSLTNKHILILKYRSCCLRHRPQCLRCDPRVRLDMTFVVKSLICGTKDVVQDRHCLLYTSPSPRDRQKSRMPSSA